MELLKVVLDVKYAVERRDDDGVEEQVLDEERCVVMVIKSRDLLPSASKVVKLLFTSACLRLASRITRKTLFLCMFELVVLLYTRNSQRDILGVNLSTIQEYVALGKLVPKQNEMITMRDLVRAGVTTNPLEGIKLLGQVSFNFAS